MSPGRFLKGGASIDRRIYLYRFVDDFMLIYPFYALLFVEQGLSTADVSMLFIGWSVVGILAEIPTGVIADRFDRRWVLALGQLTRALGYLMWFLVPEFWSFLLGFALWGIGGAFVSGTYEALLYDELKREGREGQYLRVSGRASGFALIGILLATLLASLAADPGYEVALLASVAASVVGAAVALSLPRAPAQEQVREFDYLAVTKAGFRTALSSKTLGIAIGIAAIAASAYGALEEYSTLFISDLGFDASVVAMILVVIGATDALASFLAERISGSRPSRVYKLVLLGCALLIGASAWQAQPAIVVIGLFFFVTQAATVIAEANVQHAIDSDNRATVTSVSNLVIELVSIATFGLFALAGRDDRFDGFIACAVVFAVLTTALWFFETRRRGREPISVS